MSDASCTDQLIHSGDAFNPSPAVTFAYLDEPNAFEFITDGFQEKYDSFESEQLGCDRFDDFFKSINDEDTICFGLIDGGPFPVSLYIGIRMSHETKPSD